MVKIIEDDDISQMELLQKQVELLKNSVEVIDNKQTASAVQFENVMCRLSRIPEVSSKIDRLSNDIYILQKKVADITTQMQILENINYNGKLLWKINDISFRLTQAEKGEVTALHSAPAYTDRYGYKFCARLYLNGDGVGKNDHISLFFILMKSNYDDLLEWPFYREVTFRLINPDNLERSISTSFMPSRDSPCYFKPKVNMNVASGCPLFLAKTKLFSDGYTKNNCIYIEISVD